MAASDLKADGQIFRRKAAVDAYGGTTGQTEGRGHTRSIAIAFLLAVDQRVRLDLRGSSSHGRHHEHVKIAQGLDDLLPEQRPQLQGFVVGQRRREAPGEVGDPVIVVDLPQPVPNQLPVVGGGWSEARSNS